MLEVLLAATSYPADAHDWRGRFIADMAGALACLPDVRLSVWAPPGELPEGALSALVGNDATWLAGLVQRGGIAQELRRTPLAGAMDGVRLLVRLGRVFRAFAREHGEPRGQRVVHANWLQTALPLWHTRLPALITVLGSDLPLLRLPGMAAALRGMLSGRRAILAPNAAWMLEPLRQHLGTGVDIRPMPFGIHPRWFAIRREETAVCSRDWLMVSRVTRAKLGPLLRWGAGLFGGQRRLHLFGPMQEKLDLPGWINWHGPADPGSLAEVWFPRATGLLTLSTHDEGRPQVMLEAMASGLPIVASDLPAHRDLLRGGDLGRLVPERAALVAALAALEIPAENLALGAAARAWVAAEIGDWSACARRYHAAYEELLA